MQKLLWYAKYPCRLFNKGLNFLGPRGSLICIISIFWIIVGVATFSGYSGKPQDAPHLLIPPEIRGIVCMLTGLLSLYLAPARTIITHKIAIVILSIMPVIRIVSYSISWVLSWSLTDFLLPDIPLAGSPSAYYGVTAHLIYLLVVIIISLAPRDWKTVNLYLAQEEREEKNKEHSNLFLFFINNRKNKDSK